MEHASRTPYTRLHNNVCSVGTISFSFTVLSLHLVSTILKKTSNPLCLIGVFTLNWMT